MQKKQFKTESKKLLNMMIHSIYTHKEIFLRELISNASDAIDKRYFHSLKEGGTTGIGKGDFEIMLSVDKGARTLTIADNGCGMSAEELENNLGTIAKSGSYDFKKDNDQGEEIDIIGQFGVGFYSAFMVADKITVLTKTENGESHIWESEGADGYKIGEAEKETVGTAVTLHLLADTEEEKYSDFLEEYRLKSLVKKYSDYIRHPIKMALTSHKKKEDSDDFEEVTEIQTLNSMVPLWKKSASEVSEEEYNRFYADKFFDYEPPLRVITQNSEGTATFTALMFIPSHAPYNYYSKDYERGLELYSSGVMIMEKCADLLPDYFSFVKGLVDSSDLSLNISREMLQHDRQLKLIAKALEKKIKGELEKLLRTDREKYEKFFEAFGAQLKYGLYADWGAHKEVLQDLILFPAAKLGKKLTLKEYTEAMPEGQKDIYYACGETVDKIMMLPQVEAVLAKGYEVLCFTEDVDEFAARMLEKYAEKEFKNVTADALDLGTEEEKTALEEKNKNADALLSYMKESLGNAVSSVRFTAALKNHAVCLSSEGELSIEMEKVLRKMPGATADVKANVVLEINHAHPIAEKLQALFDSDKQLLAKYAKILYAEARLIGGLSIDNPTEISEMITSLMV
ncbi:MAG: molecular chaperone HtpG [Clostridia bacterium]|nr:molecular chaperone HtpG [Clostridia bacterium]MBQ7407597.1 molecular chaperone HtpG [Clostridia bacterium]